MEFKEKKRKGDLTEVDDVRGEERRKENEEDGQNLG